MPWQRDGSGLMVASSAEMRETARRQTSRITICL